MLFRGVLLLLGISYLPVVLGSTAENQGCKSWPIEGLRCGITPWGRFPITSHVKPGGSLLTRHGVGKPNPKPTAPPPVKYGMLLFRSFEPLDVFGPLEALYALSRIHHLELSLISETMDAVTTRPVVAAMNPMNSSMVS